MRLVLVGSSQKPTAKITNNKSMSKAQKKPTGKKIDIMEEIEKLLNMTSGGSKKANAEKAVMRAIEKQFGDSFGGSTNHGSTKEGKKIESDMEEFKSKVVALSDKYDIPVIAVMVKAHDVKGLDGACALGVLSHSKDRKTTLAEVKTFIVGLQTEKERFEEMIQRNAK